MTANRRIALNVVATYGRSLYAMVLGLFTVRWALQALGSWVCVVGVRGCRLPVGSEVKVKVKGEGEQRMVLFLGRLGEEKELELLLEALAYGVPVICTKGTPWKGIAEQDCGWWIDFTCESFVRALKDALEALDEKLGEMGARARALAGTYDWRRVAERLTGLYLNRAGGACS